MLCKHQSGFLAIHSTVTVFLRQLTPGHTIEISGTSTRSFS